MKVASACSVLLLLCAGCSSLTPEEHAEIVRAMPGKKDLRIGLVVLSEDRTVRPALLDTPAGPGGAAGLLADSGQRYSERIVLPESLGDDRVLRSIEDLAAFTDVVSLPFDSRGIASRDALIQRVQDRLWPLAADNELDALLLVEGVRDRGLVFSDADESVFSLDTVLWWLAWPVSVLIPDRTYDPDVTLVASLFSIHDRGAIPQPIDASASPGSTSMHPWSRASTPMLGLVLPPAWVGDDPAAVALTVGQRSRAMLPVELVRRLKELQLPDAAEATLHVTRNQGMLELVIDSAQETIEATVTPLPRGLLAEPALPTPVTLESRLEPSTQGMRYHMAGRIKESLLDLEGRPLVRVSVTFASGASASRTWVFAQLPGRD